MLDADLRAVLLTVFYDRRKNADGWVPTSEINVNDGAASRQEIAAACQQLAQAGLIEWQPFTGAAEGIFIGRAQITGHGVDVKEGAREPKIEVNFVRSRRGAEGHSVHADAMVLLSKIAQATDGSDVPVVLEDINDLEMDEARRNSAFRSLKGMGLIEANFGIFYAARVSAEGHRVLSSFVAGPVEPAIDASALPNAAAVAEKPVEMLILKPGLWGMSIDLKEVWRRIARRWSEFRVRRKGSS